MYTTDYTNTSFNLYAMRFVDFGSDLSALKRQFKVGQRNAFLDFSLLVEFGQYVTMVPLSLLSVSFELA